MFKRYIKRIIEDTNRKLLRNLNIEFTNTKQEICNHLSSMNLKIDITPKENNAALIKKYEMILDQLEKTMISGFIQSFYPIEDQTCPVCNSNTMVVFPYPSVHSLFKSVFLRGCSSCGISYVNNNEVDLENFYEKDYAQGFDNTRITSPEPALYFSENFYAKNLNWFFCRAKRHSKLIEEIYQKPINTILDFGSGPGYLLHFVNAQQKLAVEKDSYSLKYLDYLGAKTVDIDKFKNNTINIIGTSHSLEHLYLPDLINTLAIFNRILMNDGILMIEVPNGSLLRQNIYQRHPPHVTFFSIESLEQLLTNAGFHTTSSFTIPNSICNIRDDALYEIPKRHHKWDTQGNIIVIASKINDDKRILDKNIDDLVSIFTKVVL